MQIDILYVDQKSLGLLWLCIMSCYVDLWYILANAILLFCVVCHYIAKAFIQNLPDSLMTINATPLTHQAFRPGHMSMIQRNTTSLREWVNVWSLKKRLRPNSESIMMHKDHTMKSTLMDLRLTRGLGRLWSSTSISRMVRQSATSCPRDSRITAPSLLLRLQPLPWHWTIIGTWTLYSTMLYSTRTQCLACRRLRAKTWKTLSFVISWTFSGHWHDKSTCVRFCWVPSHCGIEGNELVDQQAKETLDHDINSLTTVHYADLKPLVNSYIKQEVQTKLDVSIHGRDLYLVKPALGPPKKFLTRAEKVVITRLRIGHTKATKSHILSRGPPTTCQHCDQTLTLEHMLLECTVLQHSRNEYYTADSLGTLFETVPEACIVEFLREAGFFYLIWMAIYPEQLPI